jgi:NAD(P)-dependent dehydrogenase (short-subunit alcohol dehydrogenase family)
MEKLEGKTAIVTGSAQGIGRQIALAMSRDGANVVVLDLTEERGKPVVEEIKKLKGRAIAVGCDVTIEKQVGAMVDTVIDEFGKIDILVNNAGWQYVASLEDSTLQQWECTMAVNLRGPFLCCRAVLPHMRERGSGVIINITSRAGRVPKANATAYGVSKFGLNGLTLCLNLEVKDAGIRVLALAPPHTNTPLAREIVKDLHPDLDLSKWPDGSEFAKVVAWFASDEARELDGVIIETGGLRP